MLKLRSVLGMIFLMLAALFTFLAAGTLIASVRGIDPSGRVLSSGIHSLVSIVFIFAAELSLVSKHRWWLSLALIPAAPLVVSAFVSFRIATENLEIPALVSLIFSIPCVVFLALSWYRFLSLSHWRGTRLLTSCEG